MSMFMVLFLNLNSCCIIQQFLLPCFNPYQLYYMRSYSYTIAICGRLVDVFCSNLIILLDKTLPTYFNYKQNIILIYNCNIAHNI